MPWRRLVELPTTMRNALSTLLALGAKSASALAAPKVASDQRGHGLGVSLEVYTSSDLEQKRAALRALENAVRPKRKPKPQQPSESAQVGLVVA